MKTHPITPARIVFGDEPSTPPSSPDYGDAYHPPVGAQAQAQHVFLAGNGLPARWAGRDDFCIVETGFGLGNNFLATWQAWHDDPARCERLHFVSIERHPPTKQDLARAHARSPWPRRAAMLVEAWPELAPNLHALDFDGGRVRLLLGLGDVADLLPALRVEADAFYLDGFTPKRNPQMWQPRVLKAIGRLAAPGATLATWSVARELRDGLSAAGFDTRRAPGIGGKFAITLANFAPRFVPVRLPRTRVAASDAIVLGAGIAGAATAHALAALGLQVRVLDRHAAPANEASGNPAALFHGTVHADDGPHARLFRAAALQAQRCYAALGRQHPGCVQVQGLLRLGPSLQAMQHLLQGQGLPAAYVQALSQAEASQLAGVPLPGPAWLYPGGGWVQPAACVNALLASPRIRFVGAMPVAGLARLGEQWQLRDASGGLLAEAPIVVLANAGGAQPLLAATGRDAGWSLQQQRGQVSGWAGSDTTPTPLRLPVAGDGYALPLPDGGVLCGATSEEDVAGFMQPATLRAADHDFNFERLQRLTGLQPPADPAEWRGRAAWRCQTGDHLPIAGAWPLAPNDASARRDQARLLAREPGLFVLTGLGGRGFTLAPLLGRLIAAQATGTPWPLEQDLADAIDPARWWVRAARQAAG